MCVNVRNTKIFDFSHREAKENEPTTNPKKTLRIRRKHLAIAITHSLALSLSLSSVLNDSPSLIHVGFHIYTHMHVSEHVCTYVCVCMYWMHARPWVWSLLVWGEYV